MKNPESIVVTDIKPPVVVHSAKGRTFRMENRVEYGLSLCISGQITYTMGGKVYVSTPGKAVLLPRGGSYSLLGDQDGLFPVINFQCEGWNLKEITVLPLNNEAACINDFETLRALFLRGESRLKIFGIFYSLLSRVLSEQTPGDRRIQSVLRYIDQNLSRPGLNNLDLAKKTAISEVYLRKLFQKQLNTSPRQYILERRLQKARQLLVDTSYAVHVIAAECGFSSLYHFCRVFKKKTGMTPTEYAQQNRDYQI